MGMPAPAEYWLSVPRQGMSGLGSLRLFSIFYEQSWADGGSDQSHGEQILVINNS